MASSAAAGLAAVQLLQRIHTGNSPAPLYDDGMVIEWIDNEIAAFIREHGPLRELVVTLGEAGAVVKCKVCNGVGRQYGANPNLPCKGCGGAGKVRVRDV